jgi:HPt (histidine-containing phosphotransfer) domain-containing protein
MPFDLEGSLCRMGGDQRLFSDLAEFFFADAPELAERIGAAHRAGDLRELERAAHSLKGLAANFGAAAVVGAAAELEELGRQRAAVEAGPSVRRLQDRLEELLEALRPYLRRETAAEADEEPSQPAL